MTNTNLIELSEVIEAIDNVDWYHQNASKEMVSGAANAHEAWYRAEDINRVLENLLSEQSE